MFTTHPPKKKKRIVSLVLMYKMYVQFLYLCFLQNLYTHNTPPLLETKHKWSGFSLKGLTLTKLQPCRRHLGAGLARGPRRLIGTPSHLYF